MREARNYPETIGRRQTTADLANDLLVRTAFGSPDRLTAAVEQLSREDPDATDALALLARAVRRATDPAEPEKPRPMPHAGAPEAGPG